jgi:uncharacterized membrane protein
MNRLPAIYFVLMLMCALISDALAAKISFDALPADEKTVLAPYQKEWNQLDEKTQLQLRQGAIRWLRMTPEKRAQAAKRNARWQAMSAEQRATVQRRMAELRALSPEQRRELKRAFERFRGLPAERKAELQRRFLAMNAKEREAFLLALRAQQQSANARKNWARVPVEERAQTQAVLRSLSREQRQALRKILAPMTPEQRENFRAKLIRMTPAQRADALKVP